MCEKSNAENNACNRPQQATTRVGTSATHPLPSMRWLRPAHAIGQGQITLNWVLVTRLDARRRLPRLGKPALNAESPHLRQHLVASPAPLTRTRPSPSPCSCFSSVRRPRPRRYGCPCPGCPSLLGGGCGSRRVEGGVHSALKVVARRLECLAGSVHVETRDGCQLPRRIRRND